MEQLIFVGLLVLFSVLEAVARKGKERQGGGEDAPLPDEPPRPAPAPRPRPVPTRSGPPSYDEDPSFDERVEGRGVRPPPPPEVKEEAPARGKGSEGLIPADVWEEIQALARGEAPRSQQQQPPPPPRPAPTPRPAGRGAPPRDRTEPRPVPDRMPRAPQPVKRPSRPPPRPEVEAPGVTPEPVHAVHLTHPKYGTPVGGRLTGFAEDAPARAHSQDARAVRQMLGGGPSRLRQAVILQELLGPPVGLRDDRSEPGR